MSIRDKFDALFTSITDSNTVAPSKIGQQFYCEKKVDLEKELGEVETPEKKRGSETHEKAAEDAVEVEMEDVWDAIERGDRQILLESPFVGEAADFIVVGIPDAVIFDDGKPKLIFDRKTTSIPDHLFDNQRIQVWLYGYMLQSIGFATDELQIAILTHEQHLDPGTGKRLQQLILGSADEFDDGRTELQTSPDVYLHLSDYDPTAYLEDLRWALEYWRQERAPEPTDNAAKCRSCPFSDVCSDSLA